MIQNNIIDLKPLSAPARNQMNQKNVGGGRETCPGSFGMIQTFDNDIERDIQMQSEAFEPTQKNKIVDEQAIDPYYEMIIQENNIDEDIQCDICLDFEYEEGDEIVICEMCNVGVHQTCYGGELVDGIPNGEWFCQRCVQLRKDQTLTCRDITCFLCDEVQGCMKQIDKKENIWAHSICINWTPEIEFSDEFKNKIIGKINLERFNLTCRHCLKRN